MNQDNDNRKLSASRDTLIGAPCAHPVGTLVGAAIGAVVGGLAGKGVAESIDPTRQSASWRENFGERDDVEQGSSFDDDGPANGFGVSARGRYPERDFDEVESEMASDWTDNSGPSSLSWERARHSSRDARNRVSPSN